MDLVNHRDRNQPHRRPPAPVIIIGCGERLARFGEARGFLAINGMRSKFLQSLLSRTTNKANIRGKTIAEMKKTSAIVSQNLPDISLRLKPSHHHRHCQTPLRSPGKREMALVAVADGCTDDTENERSFRCCQMFQRVKGRMQQLEKIGLDECMDSGM